VGVCVHVCACVCVCVCIYICVCVRVCVCAWDGMASVVWYPSAWFAGDDGWDVWCKMCVCMCVWEREREWGEREREGTGERVTEKERGWKSCVFDHLRKRKRERVCVWDACVGGDRESVGESTRVIVGMFWFVWTLSKGLSRLSYVIA